MSASLPGTSQHASFLGSPIATVASGKTSALVAAKRATGYFETQTRCSQYPGRTTLLIRNETCPVNDTMRHQKLSPRDTNVRTLG